MDGGRRSMDLQSFGFLLKRVDKWKAYLHPICGAERDTKLVFGVRLFRIRVWRRFWWRRCTTTFKLKLPSGIIQPKFYSKKCDHDHDQAHDYKLLRKQHGHVFILIEQYHKFRQFVYSLRELYIDGQS